MLINPNSGYLPGSASLPTSPVAPIAPSSAVASRLARSSSDSQAEKGTSGEYELAHVTATGTKLTCRLFFPSGLLPFLTCSLYLQAVLTSKTLSSLPSPNVILE